MINKIKSYLAEINSISISDNKDLEKLKNKYLSKKGIIPKLFQELKEFDADSKKTIGKEINHLKIEIQKILEKFKDQKLSSKSEKTTIDYTLPPENKNYGSRHPISIVKNEIIEIFNSLSYTISEGPEIEDDWHVFSALNFPVEHPARDMQDTFFIGKNPDILLRTHTSSVQVRVMENSQPPIRTISPGRVFRNEAISARAHCIFHQIEGLYIDVNVSFADLKQTLLYFAKMMFGAETDIRLRPSYFPFTEPSGELDVTCTICKGKGCNVCKYTGWLEILGCGMVDPKVLELCGINHNKYTGFAFGMGIERIAMLKYQVNDLRLYFNNDLKFLSQFSNYIN